MLITKKASEAGQFIVGKEIGKQRMWCHEITQPANKISSADLGWVRCFCCAFLFFFFFFLPLMFFYSELINPLYSVLLILSNLSRFWVLGFHLARRQNRLRIPPLCLAP